MKKTAVITLILASLIFISACTQNDVPALTADVTEKTEQSSTAPVTEPVTNEPATAVPETETVTEPATETEQITEPVTEPAVSKVRTLYKFDNVTVTEEDGMITIYDFDNKVVLQDEYDSVSTFLSHYLLLKKDGGCNLFDTSLSYRNDKKYVIGLVFDRTYDWIESMQTKGSSQNTACFVVKDGDKKHPYFRGTVHTEIDCTYGCYYGHELIWAFNSEGKLGLYRLVSNNGTTVYPPDAEDIVYASNGLDMYDDFYSDPNDFYLFVCKNNKWALYYVPDYNAESADPIAEQLTDFVYDAMTRKSDGVTYAIKNGEMYTLDSKGKETKVGYTTVKEADGLKIVSFKAFSSTYGAVDGKGNVIIPLQYWNIEYIGGSFFCSGYKGEDGVVIDKSGKVLTPESAYLRFVFGFHAPDNGNSLVIAEYAGELTDNRTIVALVGADGKIIIPQEDYNGIEYGENDTYTLLSLKNGGTHTVNNKGEIID